MTWVVFLIGSVVLKLAKVSLMLLSSLLSMPDFDSNQCSASENFISGLSDGRDML